MGNIYLIKMKMMINLIDVRDWYKGRIQELLSPLVKTVHVIVKLFDDSITETGNKGDINENYVRTNDKSMLVTALQDLKVNTKRLGEILVLLDDGHCPFITNHTINENTDLNSLKDSESIIELHKISDKQQEKIKVLKKKYKIMKKVFVVIY